MLNATKSINNIHVSHKDKPPLLLYSINASNPPMHVKRIPYICQYLIKSLFFILIIF